MSAAMAIIGRDVRLALRAGGEAFTLVLFFVMIAAIAPFAIGPDKALLSRLAPGLVWIVYRQLGIDVPRFSDELIESGEAVDFDDLHPGHLVFIEHGGDPKTPAIMAERGQSDLPEVIFSSSVYGKVVVESLKDSELAGITACRRLPVQA